jgi:hypothetical protein
MLGLRCLVDHENLPTLLLDAIGSPHLYPLLNGHLLYHYFVVDDVIDL